MGAVPSRKPDAFGPARPDRRRKKKRKKKKYARSSILYLALIPVPLWQGPLILQPPDNLPRYLLTVTNGVCHYTRMCVCVCVWPVPISSAAGLGAQAAVSVLLIACIPGTDTAGRQRGLV